MRRGKEGRRGGGEEGRRGGGEGRSSGGFSKLGAQGEALPPSVLHYVHFSPSPSPMSSLFSNRQSADEITRSRFSPGCVKT
ncbi:hypothetical protein EYF80_011800 [Liparis tanakae]|uniref:Uncharacterized protein n=1 Tax=Liparis tanakae TaxID=230148 RepID=A0A4Z2IJJ4_9TELE|nr:hypothetical protein EYF80_011800 [Liparis tanakae]